jgi:hypothetical protein
VEFTLKKPKNIPNFWSDFEGKKLWEKTLIG